MDTRAHTFKNTQNNSLSHCVANLNQLMSHNHDQELLKLRFYTEIRLSNTSKYVIVFDYKVNLYLVQIFINKNLPNHTKQNNKIIQNCISMKKL